MYQKLATDLLFSKVATADLAPVYGLQFRKGKKPDDVAKAVQKAKKNGHAKVEFELAMLEVYLKGIFKKA